MVDGARGLRYCIVGELRNDRGQSTAGASTMNPGSIG